MRPWYFPDSWRNILDGQWEEAGDNSDGVKMNALQIYFIGWTVDVMVLFSQMKEMQTNSGEL